METELINITNKKIMEQKKTKIEIYLKDDEKVVANIEGNGEELLTMLITLIDQNETFKKLIANALVVLSIMKR